MNSLSRKMTNIVRRMVPIANKSPMLSQHAAVLVKNGVVVSTGHNDIWRTSSVHAEQRAIDLYLAKFGLSLRSLYGGSLGERGHQEPHK